MKICFFGGTFGSMIGGVTLMCNSLGKLHHFFDDVCRSRLMSIEHLLCTDLFWSIF